MGQISRMNITAGHPENRIREYAALRFFSYSENVRLQER